MSKNLVAGSGIDVAIDTGAGTATISSPDATTGEAQAGTDTTKRVSPLRVAQAISTLAAAGLFTHSGVSGAQAISIQQALEERLHIDRFGASPSNSAAANNTAIQAGLTQAFITGKALELGDSGDYAVTGLSISGYTTRPVEIRSTGARLTTTTNAPVISITNSKRVKLRGLSISGNAGATNNNQAGVYWDTVSDCSIESCWFENLSTAFHANNTSTTGYPLSGAFQRPSRASGNFIVNCRRGAYFRDGGAANTYGEYWQFHGNIITDCSYCGLWDEAGNTSIVGNTINGNLLGAVLFSLVAGGSTPNSNGDHGIFSLNTVNHNVAVGLYVSNNLRNWTITGNQIEGTLGGTSGTTTLASVFGGTNQGYAFGLWMGEVHNVTFTGNVVARNQFNAAFRTLTACCVRDNQFITDPAATVANTWDYSTVVYNKSNFLGPNVYFGTHTDTTTFPHDGDWNRWIDIGSTGAPAFTNSWVNYGAPQVVASMRKDGMGIVHLRGLIKSGTLNTSAFTLPAHYSPPDGVRSFGVLSNSAAGGVQITTAGAVNIVTPSSNTWVGLDGISFDTATA